MALKGNLVTLESSRLSFVGLRFSLVPITLRLGALSQYKNFFKSLVLELFLDLFFIGPVERGDLGRETKRREEIGPSSKPCVVHKFQLSLRKPMWEMCCGQDIVVYIDMLCSPHV